MVDEGIIRHFTNEYFYSGFAELMFGDVSGVVFQYFFTQFVRTDVRVYFGGSQTLVTEHSLDGSQVGTSFE